MSLSHSVQKTDKQNASLNPIIQFLDTINDVPQKYGSFEKAEQAIRELVVELGVCRSFSAPIFIEIQ